MRSIWKGSISFGLVTIPVKLYSATEQRDVAFHQVHAADGGRIRYKRVCQVDGEEVPYSEIAKGYELPGGEMVVLTDEDFADLPLSTNRVIDVLEFVPLEQVDPIYFEKSYYLEPEKTGSKPYVLLRDALEQSGRVGLVKIALRSREALATLRVRDGVFVLETMMWPDEVRDADFGFLDEDIEVRQQEITMALSLIETLSGDFDPEQYTDAYREALESVIDAKVAGREVVAPADTPAPTGQVVDLMAALQASVEAARRNRGDGAGPAQGAARETLAAAAGASAPTERARKRAPATAGEAAATVGTSAQKAKATPAKAPAKKAAPAKRAAGTKAAGTKAASRKASAESASATGETKPRRVRKSA
jgi:DNA end-binding protein Ku